MPRPGWGPVSRHFLSRNQLSEGAGAAGALRSSLSMREDALGGVTWRPGPRENTGLCLLGQDRLSAPPGCLALTPAPGTPPGVADRASFLGLHSEPHLPTGSFGAGPAFSIRAPRAGEGLSSGLLCLLAVWPSAGGSASLSLRFPHWKTGNDTCPSW